MGWMIWTGKWCCLVNLMKVRTRDEEGTRPMRLAQEKSPTVEGKAVGRGVQSVF